MKFGIAGNLDKKELPGVVQKLVARFGRERVGFVVHDTLRKMVKRERRKFSLPRSTFVSGRKLPSSCDMLISLGGDGTILSMARLAGSRETPILGINLGKLGFLAEVSLDDLDACISEILDGKYRVQARMMLEATVEGTKERMVALNDIVIDKYGSSRVMDFETYVNEEYLATFTGDGVILSTPTGSTAYALANGGPIVTPTNHSIMISPICPHTLTARPVIIPDGSSIMIRVKKAPWKARVTADGQVGKLLSTPVTVAVRKAPFSTNLVKRVNTNYYEVLREKLHWGKDVRIKSKE